MRMFACLAIAVSLASCQSAAQTNLSGTSSNPALTYLKSQDPGLRQIDDWFVICLGGKRNAVGRVSLQKHCRLEKGNRLALVWVDNRGIRVRTSLSYGSPCQTSALHAGVDGEPIEYLPVEKQIQMMKVGGVFARETQSAWPDCWISIEKTNLTRFVDAYQVLIDRWAAFKGR